MIATPPPAPPPPPRLRREVEEELPGLLVDAGAVPVAAEVGLVAVDLEDGALAVQRLVSLHLDPAALVDHPLVARRVLHGLGEVHRRPHPPLRGAARAAATMVEQEDGDGATERRGDEGHGAASRGVRHGGLDDGTIIEVPAGSPAPPAGSDRLVQPDHVAAGVLQRAVDAVDDHAGDIGGGERLLGRPLIDGRDFSEHPRLDRRRARWYGPGCRARRSSSLGRWRRCTSGFTRCSNAISKAGLSGGQRTSKVSGFRFFRAGICRCRAADQPRCCALETFSLGLEQTRHSSHSCGFDYHAGGRSLSPICLRSRATCNCWGARRKITRRIPKRRSWR